MNNIERTERLIRGSHNIDRMRAEVEETVRMVVGFALWCKGEHREVSEKFGSGLCWWHVSGEVNSVWSKSDNKLSVECYVSTVGVVTKAYGFNTGSYPFHLETVQGVYQGLPVFIEGMLKMFPELAQKWEPLIKASDVFS